MREIRAPYIRSVYQERQCPECDATILADVTKPLPRDPEDHNDDCPLADPWPNEADDDRDAAFPERAFTPR